MDKPQQGKTKWKEVISQPDAITTKKLSLIQMHLF
ncbi:hypothetical protein MNBD_GAMMA08-200 [hydrothermal vent metagenome]|uniref:Uncharacterized protein n=1 Tax=hydrothermal vent metagenome TaxID=652676 RepID=A0A3B0WQZ9_9ZZZZ